MVFVTGRRASLPSEESLALYELYLATGGETWVNNELWGSLPRTCEWYGVTCSDSNATVLRLELENNNLRGTIPTSVVYLSNLTYLKLDYNSISNTDITSLSSLRKLEYLNLSYNNIKSRIPVAFEELRNLEVLDLRNNEVSGTLKEETMLGLESLQTLILSSNSLSSTLPSGLGSLTALTNLELAYNSFTSTIPKSWASLSLVILDLSGNILSGTIPDYFGNMVSLSHLELRSNSFTGGPGSLDFLVGLINLEYLSVGGVAWNTTFPDIGNLTMLSYLDLSSCKLTGTIPESIYDFERLAILQLSYNHLSGTVSSRIGQLTNLEYLDMTFCRLSGDIPRELFQFPALTNLRMAYNRLSGTFPNDVALPKLDIFYFNDNLVEGTIPKSFSSMTRLSWLYLDSNELSGTLPLLGLRWLEYFDASDNNLEGDFCDFLGEMPLIYNFKLQQNNLSGTLCADVIADCNDLGAFQIGNNKLYGTVADSVFDAPSLFNLDLSHNFFEGRLPQTSRGSLTLLYLLLNDNEFTGTIPGEYSYFAALEYLELQNNFLSGEIERLPSFLHLRYLDISWNNFTGPMPNTFFFLAGLNSFKAAGNAFSGELPSSLSECAFLDHLDVRDNRLSSLPDLHYQFSVEEFLASNNQIGGFLPDLSLYFPLATTIDLGNNYLEGTIGTWLGSMSQLSILRLENNRLSSSIPMEIGAAEALTVLNISTNDLSSTIPSSLSLLDNLAVLVLSHNNISGSIPDLSKNQHVHMLLLDNNQMEGPTPEWLCELTAVNLSDNAGFWCPRLSCCSPADSLIFCDEGCVEVGELAFFASPWKVVYAVVGVLLCATLVIGGVVGAMLRTRRVRRYLYGAVESEQRSLYLEDIEIQGPLGSGQAGDVKKALWGGTTIVAAKTVRTRKADQSRVMSNHEFEVEATMLMGCRHPNVVQFLGLFLEDNMGVRREYIVTEYLRLGSVDNLLRPTYAGENAQSLTGGNFMSLEVHLGIARDVAAGISFLHRTGIVHRDLAARNVLVKEEGGSFLCKIGDFGMARKVNDQGVYFSNDKQECVAYKWCAPEVFTKREFSASTDMFAYGVTLWEVFSNCLEPWAGEGLSTVKENVLSGRPLHKPSDMPDHVYHSILLECANVCPVERPSGYEAYVFFQGLVDEICGTVSAGETSSGNNYSMDDMAESLTIATEDVDDHADQLYVYSSKLWN
eukprot:CAMPEP_0119119498 /NCGR_PEP_ID=MMETSP1310-20130426/966_1 /TAXON_ID=464262 /ORGANISM="Genus nov. species nov., Strain RCC2339" /LENGTH=1195 /DNA_ID=CAMNT_0007108939 /DNA_START=21 /DNA_END=3608 /DNA_ORIENTATION=-